MNKNKKELKELTDSQLLAKFYWFSVKITHESNGKGITKRTLEEEQQLVKELSIRFGVDSEDLALRIKG